MVKSKRLLKVLEYVDYVGTVADIGCDHGYLSEMLIDSGKARKVIATDISEDCLDKTRLLLAKHDLENKIQTRLGDGLTVLKPDEVDVAVIAGMGGHEIAKILGDKSRKDGIKHFVLQPMQKSVDLRRWLAANSYVIENDECVEESGKFYDVLKVKKGIFRKRLKYNVAMFGKTNLEMKPFTEDFVNRLNYEERKYTQILSNNALADERDKDLKKYLKAIKKLLKKYR